MHRFGISDNGDVVDVVMDGDDDALLVERWPPFGLLMVSRSDTAPVEPDRVVQRVEVPAAAAGDVAWDVVESELALFAAERLAGVVAVHAGVLVVDGRAVVLPGVSHAGKSTLCAAALDAGVEVRSDEYALVHADGRVGGWPRAIRLRTERGVVRRPLPVGTSAEPVPVAAVVCTTFDARAGGTELVECGRLDAMTEVLVNTVCARSRAEEAFAAASAITSDVMLLRGTRADAHEAIGVLLERLASAGLVGPTT